MPAWVGRRNRKCLESRLPLEMRGTSSYSVLALAFCNHDGTATPTPSDPNHCGLVNPTNIPSRDRYTAVDGLLSECRARIGKYIQRLWFSREAYQSQRNQPWITVNLCSPSSRLFDMSVMHLAAFSRPELVPDRPSTSLACCERDNAGALTAKSTFK